MDKDGHGTARRRRPGRPAKAVGDRRDDWITVRVNGAERALLEDRAAAAGLDVGAYVRAMGLGRRVVGVVPMVNREAWSELARTTANVNQIAAHLNGGGRFDERGTSRVAQALDTVRGELALLRRALIGSGDDADDES